MQTVYLNGSIEKFGSKWETDCRDIREIFKLIECQTPGFRAHLIKAAEADVGYEIQRGSDFLETPEEMFLSLNDEDIIITEVPSGSKSGFAKIFAAIAIVAIIGATGLGTGGVGFFPAIKAAFTGGGGFFATTGAFIATNLAMTGINQLLIPGPEVDGATENDGYLFGGPTNTIAQGIPVPLAYGQMIVGGAPISVSYQNQPINLGSFNNDGGTGASIIDFSAGDSLVNPTDTSTTGTSSDTESNPLPSEAMPGTLIEFHDSRVEYMQK
tara:strand:- start:4428 stop:5234 length:807 start_codon:yes stop_codon:yes gene_type:complete